MKEEKHSYIKGLLHGIGTLLTGMKVTGREFFTPKVTEQYPENRATLKISPRFRGRLIMPVDENGNNKCIACGLCQMACPNDTITITSESVTNEETGKKKKILVKYEYDHGNCSGITVGHVDGNQIGHIVAYQCEVGFVHFSFNGQKVNVFGLKSGS